MLSHNLIVCTTKGFNFNSIFAANGQSLNIVFDLQTSVNQKVDNESSNKSRHYAVESMLMKRIKSEKEVELKDLYQEFIKRKEFEEDWFRSSLEYLIRNEYVDLKNRKIIML